MTSVFLPPVDPVDPVDPVHADLETLEALNLSLSASTSVVVPFTVFTVNSGSFAFTSGGAFTMPRDGLYKATLSFTVSNSADADTEMESDPSPPPPGPAQLIAFMAYSGTSIANTTTFFKIQPAESKTCIVTTTIIDYIAGTEINASLEAGAGTSLLLQDAHLSVSCA